MSTKKFCITNLSTNTSVDEVLNFFGFDNPEERESCVVQLSAGSDPSSAMVEVPEGMADKVKERDGAAFGDRTINIEDTDQNQSDAVVASDATTLKTLAAVAAQQQETGLGGFPTESGSSDANNDAQNDSLTHAYVELDTSTYNNCYAVKSIDRMKITQAVVAMFGDDETRHVSRPFRRGDTKWRIETRDIQRYEGKNTLTFNGNNLAGIQVKRETLTFDPTKGKMVPANRVPGGPSYGGGPNDREDELLLTFDRANDFKFQNITNMDITKKVIEMGIGRIKRDAQLQPDRDFPGQFTENKYCILEGLKPGDKQKIPQCFEFSDRYFGRLIMWINYKGKPRRCKFCGEFHGETCDREKLIRQLEKERDELKKQNNGHLPIHTYADSTARLMTQDSLTSDVDAMSGAAIGNLLNAMDINTDKENVKNIVIIGGQNSVHKNITDEHFLWAQHTTNERLTALAEQKKIAILQPPKMIHLIPETQAREERLREDLKRLDEEHENIHVIDHPCKDDCDMPWHPDEQQTVDMLKCLDEKAKAIFETPYTLASITRATATTKNYYAKTNGLYKFGCAACNSSSKNQVYFLCDACKTACENSEWLKEQVVLFRNRIDEIAKEQSPDLGSMDSDSMSDGEDLTCRQCSQVFTKVCDFQQHFKQFHPQERERSLREKAKFLQK